MPFTGQKNQETVSDFLGDEVVYGDDVPSYKNHISEYHEALEFLYDEDNLSGDEDEIEKALAHFEDDDVDPLSFLNSDARKVVMSHAAMRVYFPDGYSVGMPHHSDVKKFR